MYEIEALWKELKMEFDQKFKLTAKQNSIIDFCNSYRDITLVNDMYKDYCKNNKCSRDYFIDVVSIRWVVYREDDKVWADMSTPLMEIPEWEMLVTSSPCS
jgi:hypothetical protein